jgi:surfeit locus 1 family protein
MRPPVHFKLRLLPALAAVAGVLLTGLLGNWQLNRAAEKAQLQRRIDHAGGQPPMQLGATAVNPVDVDYLPVEARGEFKSDGTVYIDNRIRNGVAGYEIVTPLRIEGSTRYVLVNRGWVKAGASRSQLPEVATPTGAVTIAGIALPGNPRFFELSSRVQTGRLWENVTVDRYSRVFGQNVQPIFIQQHNDLGDGLTREWTRPDAGIDRHRAYALQWFSMCAAIIAIYVGVNVRRATRGKRPS